MRVKPDHTALEDLGFVHVPAGTFWMGSPDDRMYHGEYPRHRVTLSRPFLLSVTPVTQSQWRALAGAAELPEAPSLYPGDRRPVEQVSWIEATRWCNALSESEGRVPAYTFGTEVEVDLHAGYRLPTEAEWEYACRAGTDTLWICSEADLAKYAWFDEATEGGTHPVGEKRPNDWGLHDMHGNVWEWCGDGAYRAYTAAPIVDPFLPGTPDGRRVIRGGAYDFSADRCRSAKRVAGFPDFRDRVLSFRVVLPV